FLLFSSLPSTERASSSSLLFSLSSPLFVLHLALDLLGHCCIALRAGCISRTEPAWSFACARTAVLDESPRTVLLRFVLFRCFHVRCRQKARCLIYWTVCIFCGTPRTR